MSQRTVTHSSVTPITTVQKIREKRVTVGSENPLESGVTHFTLFSDFYDKKMNGVG